MNRHPVGTLAIAAAAIALVFTSITGCGLSTTAPQIGDDQEPPPRDTNNAQTLVEPRDGAELHRLPFELATES